jgi:MYXO-CTERM domain-containing protein
MHRSVVGIALAFASLVVSPRAARADINYPAIPSNINPATVTWFYGCTDALPGACLTMGIGRTTSGPDAYVAFYGPGAGLLTPFGVQYSVNDSWSWQLPDGSCSGAENHLFWAPDSCFVQNIQFEVFRGRVDWLAPNPPPILGTVSAPIVLTATPEPASISFVATGLVALVGVGVIRRRRSLSTI